MSTSEDWLTGIELNEWEPRNDKYYYGIIPEDVNLDSLKIILINGLINYINECKLFYELQGGSVNIHCKEFDEMLNMVLDGWFAHDYENEDEFDYLLNENCDDYFESIVNSALAAFENSKYVLK